VSWSAPRPVEVTIHWLDRIAKLLRQKLRLPTELSELRRKHGRGDLGPGGFSHLLGDAVDAGGLGPLLGDVVVFLDHRGGGGMVRRSRLRASAARRSRMVIAMDGRIAATA
jgi:hypothetical protein